MIYIYHTYDIYIHMIYMIHIYIYIFFLKLLYHIYIYTHGDGLLEEPAP